MTLVLGGGVSGLSAGIRLLQAGHTVTIWARDLSPHTTSNVAAAVWYPYKAYPEERVLGWAAATFGVFSQLEAEPSAGVMLREGIELFPYAAPDPWWKPAVPHFRHADVSELPPGYADGYVFEAHVVAMDKYLPFLMRRFTELGGQIEQRTVATLDEAFQHDSLVVNCVGFHARELVGDQSMLAIRGQVVRVAQVGLTRFVLDDHGQDDIAYIVPRGDDIILGGVAQEGREGMAVDPETAVAIVQRCLRLEPRLRDATILEHRVGLRPGRPAVRLEREVYAPGQILLHNYGHGGAGVTLSWGCAEALVRLL